MKLKIDLHVHTTDSNDAFVLQEEIPAVLKERGLDGAAITNHDVFSGVAPSEAIILPGIEVSTRQGHITGIGVTGPIARGKSADDTISEIQRDGGVAIVVHPYDLASPCVRPFQLESRPDALEVINADALFFRLNTSLARRAAERLGLPMVGGSDSHIPETIGDAYTAVESRSTTMEDILSAIRAGQVEPVGGPTALAKKLLKLGRTLRSL